jgi:hypothetical protein
MWQINNTLLNNQRVKKVHRWKKIPKDNDNQNTMNQNLLIQWNQKHCSEANLYLSTPVRKAQRSPLTKNEI